MSRHVGSVMTSPALGTFAYDPFPSGESSAVSWNVRRVKPNLRNVSEINLEISWAGAQTFFLRCLRYVTRSIWRWVKFQTINQLVAIAAGSFGTFSIGTINADDTTRHEVAWQILTNHSLPHGNVSQSAFRIQGRWRVEKTTACAVRARHSSAGRQTVKTCCPRVRVGPPSSGSVE